MGGAPTSRHTRERKAAARGRRGASRPTHPTPLSVHGSSLPGPPRAILGPVGPRIGEKANRSWARGSAWSEDGRAERDHGIDAGGSVKDVTTELTPSSPWPHPTLSGPLGGCEMQRLPEPSSAPLDPSATMWP